MNDNILDDLFYGKIDPWEERPTNIEEFRQLNQKMGQLSDVLESRLDDDTRELLDQYISIRADMEMLLASESFKNGFRLGMKLLMAVLNKP
jgi:hypothetical protein